MTTAATAVALEPVHRPAVLDAIESRGCMLAPAENADVLVWDGRITAELGAALARGTGLRWVHVWPAGADRLFELDLFDHRLLWTTGRGAYGEAVAECALLLMLAGLRDAKRFLLEPANRAQTGRSLWDLHVGIVGGGAVAVNLIRLLRPFRARITVLRRRLAAIDGAYQVLMTDEIDRHLHDFDALVLACPLTAQTRGLVGRARLEAMRPGAWLVNVGRGALVDHDALADVLAAGHLGGAGLDVTDPEPLPAGHRLLSLDNCLLFPHVGNTWEMSEAPFAARVADNLGRYLTGGELVGQVRPDDRPS